MLRSVLTNTKVVGLAFFLEVCVIFQLNSLEHQFWKEWKIRKALSAKKKILKICGEGQFYRRNPFKENVWTPQILAPNYNLKSDTFSMICQNTFPYESFENKIPTSQLDIKLWSPQEYWCTDISCGQLGIWLSYNMFFLLDLKNQKVVPHPPPTIHHHNNKKVSALKSDGPLAVRLRSYSQGDKFKYRTCMTCFSFKYCSIFP